jgi:hypothetical protein
MAIVKTVDVLFKQKPKGQSKLDNPKNIGHNTQNDNKQSKTKTKQKAKNRF